jgi:hypothetical protein
LIRPCTNMFLPLSMERQICEGCFLRLADKIVPLGKYATFSNRALKELGLVKSSKIDEQAGIDWIIWGLWK